MREILLVLIVLTIFGCVSRKQNNALIGKWYTNDPKFELLEIEFKKDSVYQRYFRNNLSAEWNQNANWETKRNEIKLTNITGTFQDRENLVWIYKLNKQENRLNIKIKGDTTNFPILIKAKSAFDFFVKNIELKIDLPETGNALESAKHINQSFEVYAGYNKNSFIVKTKNSNNLANIQSEVENFKSRSRKEFLPFLYFTLIADKNIPNKKIDSIIRTLKETSVKKVYRVYKTSENNYLENLNWLGVKN